MTEDTEIPYEINKLKSNLAKLKEIVNKANSTKENKKSLLKKAKENKLIPKDERKQFSNDIENFDKIAKDKALIKKAKAKLIELELGMSLSEYNSLQEEYTQTHTDIKNQVIKTENAKLIELELGTALSEYASLQEEYTQTHTEIENQVNK
jgi:hypothetical protein